MQCLANKQHSIASNLLDPSIIKPYKLNLLGYTTPGSHEPSLIRAVAEESAAS
jgi:hypothetical protein